MIYQCCYLYTFFCYKVLINRQGYRTLFLIGYLGLGIFMVWLYNSSQEANTKVKQNSHYGCVFLWIPHYNYFCLESMFSYINERMCKCIGQFSFVVPLGNSQGEGSRALSVFLPVQVEQKQWQCKQGWPSGHRPLGYWSLEDWSFQNWSSRAFEELSLLEQ